MSDRADPGRARVWSSLSASPPTRPRSGWADPAVACLGLALPLSCMGRILGSQRLSLAPLGPSCEPQRLSPPHGGPWEDPARGQSPLMPALLPTGERDHAEGLRLCPPSGRRRPDHGGEAVHGLGRLLYRPLGPLPPATSSALGSQPPDGGPPGAWGMGGRGALISAAHPLGPQPSPGSDRCPAESSCSHEDPVSPHPLPHPALLPRTPGAMAPGHPPSKE